MAKQTFIEKGLVKEGNKGAKFGFNLTKWLKARLAEFGVSYIDEDGCCSGSSEGFPVRLNAAKTGYEYLDVDGTWKAGPAGGGA